MILHIPTRTLYNTRFEAKRGLGGEDNYNLAHKKRELLFINSTRDIEKLLEITINN